MSLQLEIVTQEGLWVYKGTVLDLPFKEPLIVNKSIEVFDDEDPCVIHRSFVTKKIAEEFLKKIPLAEGVRAKLQDYPEAFDMLQVKTPGPLWITFRKI